MPRGFKKPRQDLLLTVADIFGRNPEQSIEMGGHFGFGQNRIRFEVDVLQPTDAF